MKQHISTIFSGILVCCAVLICVLVIRQQFFLPEDKPELITRKIPDWQKLDIKGYRLGDADAPVQIIEFFDYECPYCQEVSSNVQTIGQKYSQEVSVVFEHFPLNNDHAFDAAVAAECAGKQNKFEAYHKLLFLNQNQLSVISYDSLAAEAEIKNIDKFKQCFDSRETSPIVQSGIDLATQLNIEGVPTFLINGYEVPGALSEQQFDYLIKEVLLEN